MSMQNIASFPSCEQSLPGREVVLFGKRLRVKDYICSHNGGPYLKKPGELPRLQLTVCLTSYCNLHCPFCCAHDTDKKRKVNLKQLEHVLRLLKRDELLRGVSISGGEPFIDFALLNDAIDLIFDIVGFDCELSINTNGTGVDKLHRIHQLAHLDAIHISRHHDDDALNRMLFGAGAPSGAQLKRALKAIPYRELIVFNCLLLKDYIHTADDAHRFMDFAIETGAGKVAFIDCMPVNEYARRQRVEYTQLLRKDDPSLLMTQSYRDYDCCRCQDGVYASPKGKLMPFYARCTSARQPYVRGLVYGADDRLRGGFNGEILYDGKGNAE